MRYDHTHTTGCRLLHTYIYIYVFFCHSTKGPHCRRRRHHLLATLISLEKVGIDKEGAAQQHSLFSNSSLVGKGDIECIRIRKELGRQRLWLFENLANVRSISVRD